MMRYLTSHMCVLMRVLLLTMLLVSGIDVRAQRTVTPVTNERTQTQAINEFKGDSVLMKQRTIARIKASMKAEPQPDGDTIWRDTISGNIWRDTTIIRRITPMQYPLLHAASVSVDIWNPLMRAFGQHYGLIDFGAQLSLHNRYKPTFETGIGLAKNTPAGNNFTYRSPMSMYMRIGADYNFLYNSNSDYQFFAGIRYGFSRFGFEIDDITITSQYWGDTATPTIPKQTTNVGWMEVVLGLKVQIWGPISAGWTFRYHKILHESVCPYGNPWYIPGYGNRETAISGSINITYTLNLNKKESLQVNSQEEPSD